MRLETAEQDKFDGITIQVPTPDGTMFVTILEDLAGKPMGVQIHIGKAGAPIAAWSNALARIISLALDKGADMNDLVSELSSQTSDKNRMSTRGEIVRSGVEGLWIALMQYKRDKFDATAKTLGDVDARGRSSKLGR